MFQIREIPKDLHYHEGETVDIALGQCFSLDQGGYHTRIEVYIREKATGKVHKRIGDGRQIGNFHPIWINWKGEKIPIESLLNPY